MNSSHAASIGLAAALVGVLTQTETALAEASTPEPAQQKSTENAADPLDADPRAGEHELQTSAMTKLCDLRCQVVAFAEDTVPGLGASQVLYTVLYPGKMGLTIAKPDGTTAVKFTVMPTKITSGKGLVATGTF